MCFGWYTGSDGGLLGWSDPLLLAGTVHVLAVSSELSVVTSVDEEDGCEILGAGADIDLDGRSYLRSVADSIFGGAECTPLLELHKIELILHHIRLMTYPLCTYLLDDWIDPGLEVMESGGDLEFVWAWIVNPLANPGFL